MATGCSNRDCLSTNNAFKKQSKTLPPEKRAIRPDKQKTIGRYRIRTCDRLIKSQQAENYDNKQNKDSPQAERRAYKPAYKKS